MSAERERPPPARPWYDRVMREAAVRGWGVAELARRAKVGRPTLYGWRDNPGKPQSAKVNAVADALGIPRTEALQLAGVIAAAPEPDARTAPRELVAYYGKAVIAAIEDEITDPAARERVWERMLSERDGDPEPPPTGPGAKTPPQGTRRHLA